MTRIFPGDIVDYTVKGVRVVGIMAMTGRVSTIADEHGDEYRVPPQAAIERVGPEHWPPRIGDLWRGSSKIHYYAVATHPQGPVRFRVAYNERQTWDPEDIRRDEGPGLELLYREPQPVPPGMRCPHRDLDDPTRCDCPEARRP